MSLRSLACCAWRKPAVNLRGELVQFEYHTVNVINVWLTRNSLINCISFKIKQHSVDLNTYFKLQTVFEKKEKRSENKSKFKNSIRWIASPPPKMYSTQKPIVSCATNIKPQSLASESIAKYFKLFFMNSHSSKTHLALMCVMLGLDFCVRRRFYVLNRHEFGLVKILLMSWQSHSWDLKFSKLIHLSQMLFTVHLACE